MKQPSLQQRINGITESGQRVVRFFDLVETHGVPLEDCIAFIYACGLVPDFAGFIIEARTHGWNVERLMGRLDAAVCDAMGQEFRDAWSISLCRWLAHQTFNI